MAFLAERRRRIRTILIIITLATLPCYCLGLVIMQIGRAANQPTETPTLTLTPTDTSTPTATPTPAAAQAVNVRLPDLQLRQFPGGPVIGPVLRSGTSLTVLYGYQISNGLVWVEVQDAEGRIGWVPLIYLITVTPTPTWTAAPSETSVSSTITPFP